MDAWSILQEVSSETEALLLQGYLDGAGVTCQVESLVYHAEPVTLGQLARVRIWVRRDQLPEAQELLRTLAADPAGVGDAQGGQD